MNTPTKNSRYAKEALPNHYLHSYHAGNIGDVWKHLILVDLLVTLQQDPAPIRFLDAYAGAGSYRLNSTGEWTEGIGALLTRYPELGVSHPLIERFLTEIQTTFREHRTYHGSPCIMQQLLRVEDSLELNELADPIREELGRQITSPRCKLHATEGAEVLRAFAAGLGCHRGCALIDPPWHRKEDWISIPRACIQAIQAAPQLTLALWFPIKSYTRVNSMKKLLEQEGVRGAFLELITTKLSRTGNRLNGSGVFLVNAPRQVLVEAGALAAIVGPACATHEGYWEFHVTES